MRRWREPELDTKTSVVNGKGGKKGNAEGKESVDLIILDSVSMFEEKGIDKNARLAMFVNHSSWFGVFLSGKGVTIVTFVTQALASLWGSPQIFPVLVYLLSDIRVLSMHQYRVIRPGKGSYPVWISIPMHYRAKQSCSELAVRERSDAYIAFIRRVGALATQALQGGVF